MYSEGFVSRAQMGRAAKVLMALLVTLVISSTPAATLTVAWDASISANFGAGAVELLHSTGYESTRAAESADGADRLDDWSVRDVWHSTRAAGVPT